MPTLSASSSIFQLAFGVNAVLPVLISDFEAVRKDAAESFLEKIKEYHPEFELKQEDRINFVDFTFNSSTGLRRARIITRLTGFISLVLCGLSLVALCGSALEPDQQISSSLFFAFVGATLIVGPIFYFARNQYLQSFYRGFVSHSDKKSEVLLFAHCVKAYLTFKRKWERYRADESISQIPVMIWKLRLMRIQMRLVPLRHWLRSLRVRLKKSLAALRK
jgi:O-antigen ligase